MPLPPGFTWAEHLGRPTLYYDRRILADYQGHDGCWTVWVGLHRMQHAHRRVTLASKSAAVDYVERWATKWEAELRAEVPPLIPLPVDWKEPVRPSPRT